jgi:hypothetical protein
MVATAVAPPAATAAVRTVAARPVVPPQAPLLDVATINREIPIDVDISAFDGRRRRRRMRVLLVLAILIVFGSLFAMLAQSYAPQH